MVECLERQADFSTKDRAYCGSLLSAVLIQNMPFLTDVVFTLLQKLISRAATEKQPQLMLR